MLSFHLNFSIIICFLCLLHEPNIHVKAKCTCEPDYQDENTHTTLSYKLAAMASIFTASALGVLIPLLLKNSNALQPDSPIHFLTKAFAAGVILATGFIHILPDAFESLTSPCIGQRIWGRFPFAGLIAMILCIMTLLMEAFATGYHRRAEMRKAQPLNGDDEENDVSDSHDIVLQRSNSSDLIRNRIVSQILELGIVVHSVIIGVSLGANPSLKTIRPLIAALSFHQFFEGIGLGGCISQARLKLRAMTYMVLFFLFTTPTGIAIGIIISNTYNKQSPGSLIVEGVLNSASAGILIYMALVDLLAADFMNTKLQTNLKLQLGSSLALLLGAGCMSLLAQWGT